MSKFTQYQYNYTILSSVMTQEDLNAVGEEGWELTCILSELEYNNEDQAYETVYRHVFKRKIIED